MKHAETSKIILELVALTSKLHSVLKNFFMTVAGNKEKAEYYMYPRVIKQNILDAMEKHLKQVF